VTIAGIELEVISGACGLCARSLRVFSELSYCDPKLEMSLFSKFELSLFLYRIMAKILLRRPRHMREDREGMKKGQ
jgi:hypothetical protein